MVTDTASNGKAKPGSAEFSDVTPSFLVALPQFAFFLFYLYMTTRYQVIDTNDAADSISSVPISSGSIATGGWLDDHRPLLSRSSAATSICDEAAVEDAEPEPSATPASSSINLANTILGTGMLAMVNQNVDSVASI